MMVFQTAWLMQIQVTDAADLPGPISEGPYWPLVWDFKFVFLKKER